MPSNSYFGFYVLLIPWLRWRLSRAWIDTPSSSYFGFYVLFILWLRWRPSRARTDTPSNSYFGFYVLFILWSRWRPSRVRTDTPSSTMSPSAFSSKVSASGFLPLSVSFRCFVKFKYNFVDVPEPAEFACG
jgi:hypothetical protein